MEPLYVESRSEEESNVESRSEEEPETSQTKCLALSCCTCCCCILAVLVIAYFFLVNYLSDQAIAEFLIIDETKVMEFCTEGLTMANITTNIWWPGCGKQKFTQSCTEPCYDVSILEDMNTFNKENPGKIVYYPSRRGTGHDGKDIQIMRLGGWWLPAPTKFGVKTPRIVLQHGFTSNSNKKTVQLTAYTLRSIGFSVLVNNFRDHCYSGKSETHIYEWGHAYPYDLLGAWDYARTDPDGQLQGSLPHSRVGLQGFSKGGFITSAAFGMEGNVPAAWVDAPPFTPKVSFAHGAQKRMNDMGIGFLSVLLIDPVWKNVEKAALSKGVDLNENLPERTLPNGPNTDRPIFAAANTDDDTVPFPEHEMLMDFLAKYPMKYESEEWVSSGFCHGRAHNYEIFAQYEEYKRKLCRFWTKAFDMKYSYCEL